MCDHQIEELKEKNHSLEKDIQQMKSNLEQKVNETCEQYQKQINDFAKQSVIKSSSCGKE